jgi:hypothetical protein
MRPAKLDTSGEQDGFEALLDRLLSVETCHRPVDFGMLHQGFERRDVVVGHA